MKKILIPVDSSEYSKRSVEKGKELAKALNSDIILLTVIPERKVVDRFSPVQSDKTVLKTLLTKEMEGAERLLKEYKDSLADTGGNVETVIKEGIVVDEIIDFANSNNEVDFVIMGSHGIGASALARTFLGSVTDKAIHFINKPVFITR